MSVTTLPVAIRVQLRDRKIEQATTLYRKWVENSLNQMAYMECAICGKRIQPGEEVWEMRNTRLIHCTCLDNATTGDRDWLSA